MTFYSLIRPVTIFILASPPRVAQNQLTFPFLEESLLLYLLRVFLCGRRVVLAAHKCIASVGLWDRIPQTLSPPC